MSTPGQRTYSVELIGFLPADRTVFASTFALSQRRPIRYVQHRDAGSRPDLYLVDADDLKAMVEFSGRSPDAMHPAILIGTDTHGTGWPVVARPIRWIALFDLLDRSMAGAETARSAFPDSRARNRWPFVDRRSRPRLDVDLNSPAEYAAMRAGPHSTSAGVLGAVTTLPATAGRAAEPALAISPSAPQTATQARSRVLVADSDPRLRRLIGARCAELRIELDVADSGEQAMSLLGRHDYLSVFVDREIDGIGGLEICRLVKSRHDRPRPMLVLTNQRGGAIERVRANMAGCDAQLGRPPDEARLAELIPAVHSGTQPDAR